MRASRETAMLPSCLGGSGDAIGALGSQHVCVNGECAERDGLTSASFWR